MGDKVERRVEDNRQQGNKGKSIYSSLMEQLRDLLLENGSKEEWELRLSITQHQIFLKGKKNNSGKKTRVQ